MCFIGLVSTTSCIVCEEVLSEVSNCSESVFKSSVEATFLL